MSMPTATPPSPRPSGSALAATFEVRFEVVAPESMKLPATLPGGAIHDADRSVTVADTVHGHAIELVRTADIPAGRVQPGREYEAFRHFVQEADALLDREVYLGK